MIRFRTIDIRRIRIEVWWRIKIKMSRMNDSNAAKSPQKWTQMMLKSWITLQMKKVRLNPFTGWVMNHKDKYKLPLFQASCLLCRGTEGCWQIKSRFFLSLNNHTKMFQYSINIGVIMTSQFSYYYEFEKKHLCFSCEQNTRCNITLWREFCFFVVATTR